MDSSCALASDLLADRESFLAFLRKRVRSAADAEDILQQALLRATAHAEEVRDPEDTRAWFFRILRRTVADHYARWSADEAKVAGLAAEIETSTPETLATCACSLGQLERIRPEYADILRRVDIDEQSIAEAADALGVTVNNAGVRLHRARKALREQLAEFCGTESARACLDCKCE